MDNKIDKRKTKSGKREGDKSELLTKEEMSSLENVVASNLFFRTLYKTLKLSGRRIGEIYGTYKNKTLIGGIRLKDIDFNSKQIKTIILKTKKQKVKRTCAKCSQVSINPKDIYCKKCGEELEQVDLTQVKKIIPIERYFPMRPELEDALKIYINNHNPKFKDSDYVFREFSLKYLQKKIKEHIKEAGIKKNFSLHGFRHYFISNAIKNGITESQIIKWTGHTNTASLQSYNQLVPDDLRDKFNAIEL